MVDRTQETATRLKSKHISKPRLSEDQVRIVFKHLRNGMTRRAISRMMNVHPGTITRIARGQTWKHLQQERHESIR